MTQQLELALIPQGELRTAASSTKNENLTELYEHYASLFPNPHLIREQQERRKLLEAIAAASHQKEAKKPSGWFGFLWGRKSEEDSRNDDDTTIDASSQLCYQLPNNDADALLGTDSLDTSCIPMEAHAAARWQLTSSRAHTPLVVRSAWERPGTPLLTILDFGILVEAKNDTAQIQYTSDYERLQQLSGVSHSIRACCVGPNLLAVSWGCNDVILYRRLIAGHSGKDWQAVAILCPSPDVLEELGEDEAYLQESLLLRVTDMVPLVVEQMDQIPAVTLAIARLSGFVELVPLPHALWYGPELSVSPQKNNKLPILQTATVLSTAEYHLDITALDAFRTRVEEDTVWDQERYPHLPPAEYVLAATGSNEQQHQVVTFWSISTVLGSPDAPLTIGFSLVAQLAEIWDLGKAGPDISIMATEGILQHWRKPRIVELRDEAESNENLNEMRVTTLSLAAPIVSLRFLCETDCIRLAMLDWNSGVTVLDCDLLERSASQSLSLDEYEMIHRNEAEHSVPLVRLISHRSSVLESLWKDPPPTIVGVEWPSRALLRGSPVDSCIMALSTRPSALHIVPIGLDPSLPLTSVDIPGSAVSRLHRLPSGGKISTITTLSKSTFNGNEQEVVFAKLEALDAKEIVRALARDSKWQEAISTYSTISAEDQQAVEDTIEDCRRQLWRSNRDFTCLEDIKDAEYVFQEALRFGDLHSDEDDDLQLFDQYRRVHKASLARLLKEDQTSSISQQIHSIRERLIMAGTYELLCAYMGVPSTFQRFHQEFLPVTPSELAISFARMSDMVALSVICCRHYRTCLDGFKVLDEIPLTIPTHEYQHLLPVTRDDGFFFFEKSDSIASIERMPEFVKNLFEVDCILDTEDARLVLEDSMSDRKSKESKRKTEEWYLARTHKIESFLSAVSDLCSFTRLSLIALAIDKDTVDSPAANRLLLLQQKYRIMLDMAADRLYNGEFVKRFNNFHDDLECMALEELLGLVLEGEEKQERIIHKFQNYFLPLAEQYAAADKEFAIELSGAVCDFCQHAALNCDSANALRRVVSLSSSFASSSRTSILKEKRIIKEKNQLMHLILVVSDAVMELGCQLIQSENDMHYVMDGLWTMYESLPVDGLSPIDVSGDYVKLCKLADNLLHDLVAIEICSKWRGSDGFFLVMQRRKGRESLSSTDTDIVASICEAFCSQVTFFEHRASEDLLSHLVADINSLTRMALHCEVDVKGCILNALLRPLLQTGQIHLLAEFISISERSWLDFDSLKGDIALFVNDAAFSDDENVLNGGVNAAISCQELLSHLLPGTDVIFNEVRKYLDAAHFINTAILSTSAEIISPAEVRRLSGEALVDLLIERDPFVAVLHAEKWKNSDWAKATNALIRSAMSPASFYDNSPVSPTEERVLPGQAILRLANILTMQQVELLTIKIKMAHLCTQNAMYGAAAALCRLILVEKPMLSPSQTNRLLSVVIHLISGHDYTDLETKRELCMLIFALKYCELSMDASAKLNSVVASSTRMDYEHFSSYRVVNPMPSLHRLCRDTSDEYAVNLVDLFTSLHTQSETLTVDDELLNTVGRYTAFWCIAQCTRPRLGDPLPFDTICITFNFLLSNFIFLHINNTALRSTCFEEIRTIFADQKASAMNLNLPNLAVEWLKPADSIVQRLTNRGYSLNGALRATSMTQNRGYNDALQWAVSHSLDKGFDDPILLLKKREQVYILKEGLVIMDRGMLELPPMASNLNSRASFAMEMGVDTDFSTKLYEPQDVTKNSKCLRKLEASNGSVKSASIKSTATLNEARLAEPSEEHRVCVENNEREKGPFRTKNEMISNGSIEERHEANELHPGVIVEQNVKAEEPVLGTTHPPPRPGLSVPPPPPPRDLIPTKPPSVPANLADPTFPQPSPPTFPQPSPRPKPVVAPPPPPPRSTPQALRAVPLSAHPPQAAPPQSATVHRTYALQTPKRKDELNTVPLTPKTRSVMLKRGEVLLRTSKAASPDLPPDDRQRLIAEGRRLLQQSRQKATTPSTQHRYSLRSRGSPIALFHQESQDSPANVGQPAISTDVRHMEAIDSPTNSQPMTNALRNNMKGEDAGNAFKDEDVDDAGWDFDEDDL
ncbi:hypothetical protein FisN_16Lh052 [Fistulifera solaris]|uniref:UBA domain-containing protein n=1 Tax=Fistulifera solaris TaxID=1519565 RepID=A0A1Z5KJA7_FISSO|nr:hypothetical protein FisN_16Lh052 [Fistulifera solaris]|eukprot:GAX26225.1 hypothetical protein FisN_16Lh052 [Fistulifera solaris]